MTDKPEFSERRRCGASRISILAALDAAPDPRGWISLLARVHAAEHAQLDRGHGTAWICECASCKLTRRNLAWLASNPRPLPVPWIFGGYPLGVLTIVTSRPR